MHSNNVQKQMQHTTQTLQPAKTNSKTTGRQTGKAKAAI